MTDSLARDVLPDDKVAPEAARQRNAFHADYVAEVKAAVAKNRVVIVGMAQNPVVKNAKKLLQEKGIAFTSIDHGSYLSGYRRRLAIKMWAGFPTFPMCFVDGVLIGGFSELKPLVESGGLKA